MDAIKATWQNGQILPTEKPLDWPEGSELVVEPVATPSGRIGLGEPEWTSDAAALADWDAWLPTIEPLELTDAERAEHARYRDEFRRHNLEAVRRQMAAGVGNYDRTALRLIVPARFRIHCAT